MLDTATRQGFNGSHDQFRETVRKFLAKEAEPYLDKWEAEGITSKAFWMAAGKAGLLCASMPEAYGGVGLDVSYDLVRQEEMYYLSCPAGVGLQSLIMCELGQERVSLATCAQAQAQRAFDEAVKFVKDRKAFGQPIFDFQNTRFALANMSAQLQAGWAYLDWARMRLVAGQLTSEEAAACKLWHSENVWRIVDAALQLHGGAGYMNEYPIARLWRDARLHRIHGGTSEIMKEVISRRI